MQGLAQAIVFDFSQQKPFGQTASFFNSFFHKANYSPRINLFIGQISLEFFPQHLGSQSSTCQVLTEVIVQFTANAAALLLANFKNDSLQSFPLHNLLGQGCGALQNTFFHFALECLDR